MKMEARSYLKAKGLEDLCQKDMQREKDMHYEVELRDMDEEDTEYFEKTIIHHLSQFCESFLKLDIRRAVVTDTVEAHIKMTGEEYLENHDDIMEKLDIDISR